MLKLGLRGISVFQASGDSGVQLYEICDGENETIFATNYMTSCPYVTSVGATALAPDAKPGDKE